MYASARLNLSALVRHAFFTLNFNINWFLYVTTSDLATFSAVLSDPVHTENAFNVMLSYIKAFS